MLTIKSTNMKQSVTLLLLVLLSCLRGFARQENAAPSMHLVYSFPADAVVKIHKIKIVQSAMASYFSVHNFAGGYSGLQQTPDAAYSTPNILIASLWDANTATGDYSTVAYSAPTTITSRFGGEGDGWKTINPYSWSLNTWYNLAERSWKSGGKIYIATFIQNISTGQWFHTSTLSRTASSNYLGSGMNAFLENWTGYGATTDGRFIRKAFFKDAWNLNTSGVWQKSTGRYVSANAGDAYRNGIYHWAFNAGFDAGEDAYFMQHGGSTTPSADFAGGRTLTLPVQTNQGTSPTLTTGAVTAVTASYANNQVSVSWTNSATMSPQWISTVEVVNSSGTVVSTAADTLPERRSRVISTSLPAGSYTARVTIRDIFNQSSAAVSSTSFTAGASNTYYKIKNVHSNLFMTVENNGTANGAYIVQASSSTNYAQQWSIVTTGTTAVLVNRLSNRSVHVQNGNATSGNNVVLYDNNGSNPEKWTLTDAGSGKKLIQTNLSATLVIDNPGSSTTSGTRLILYAKNGSTGTPNQQWLLEPVGSGLRVATSPAADATPFPAGKIFLVTATPGSTGLIIRFSPSEQGKKELSIYDQAGRKVRSVVTSDQQVNLPVGAFPKGVYFINYKGKAEKIVL